MGVAEGGGVTALAEAIERVLSVEGGYLEAPDAEEGLAAAEIIARLSVRPGQRDAYTAAIGAWISASPVQVSDELREKARRSLARILTAPSELLELWTASGDFDGWKRVVEGVAQRL